MFSNNFYNVFVLIIQEQMLQPKYNVRASARVWFIQSRQKYLVESTQSWI